MATAAAFKADACKALQLAVHQHGASHFLTRLHQHEKQVTPQPLGGSGGNVAVLISESGLYKLVLRSDKPEAREFQDWVTQSVLPALRKDGVYVVGWEQEGHLSPMLSHFKSLNISWSDGEGGGRLVFISANSSAIGIFEIA